MVVDLASFYSLPVILAWLLFGVWVCLAVSLMCLNSTPKAENQILDALNQALELPSYLVQMQYPLDGPAAVYLSKSVDRIEHAMDLLNRGKVHTSIRESELALFELAICKNAAFLFALQSERQRPWQIVARVDQFNCPGLPAKEVP